MCPKEEQILVLFIFPCPPPPTPRIQKIQYTQKCKGSTNFDICIALCILVCDIGIFSGRRPV